MSPSLADLHLWGVALGRFAPLLVASDQRAGAIRPSAPPTPLGTDAAEKLRKSFCPIGLEQIRRIFLSLADVWHAACMECLWRGSPKPIAPVHRGLVRHSCQWRAQARHAAAHLEHAHEPLLCRRSPDPAELGSDAERSSVLRHAHRVLPVDRVVRLKPSLFGHPFIALKRPCSPEIKGSNPCLSSPA